jgi:teichuronic acid biosynthesis glycosyltransferase TuaG
MQTYNNWELLIVDDASYDNTCEIVEEQIKHDNRIKLIRLKQNKGCGNARNVALRAARGKYIAFLDSDDIWLPDKLDKQVFFMKSNGFAFSYTQYRPISDNGNTCGDIIPIPDSLNYKQLLKHNIIGCLTVMIDREKIGPISMMMEPRPDYILWLHILKRGFVAYGLHEDVARYRIAKNSISRNKIKAAKGTWNIYTNVEQLNLLQAVWYFINYAIRSLIKNYKSIRSLRALT